MAIGPTSADLYTRKKEYTPEEQAERVKKKADFKVQHAPEQIQLGKEFDKAVQKRPHAGEEIKSIVERMLQAEMVPTTKHLERAITYVEENHLVEIVQMLLKVGAKPDAESSVKKAEIRKTEFPGQQEVCDKVIQLLKV